MYRLSCMIIGYLFGCYLTAEFIVKRETGKSVSELGSGNPGMVNVAKELGKKDGFLVLLGDILKVVIAYAICYHLFHHSLGRLIALYTGLGTILGHDYPFWHGGRGGMGVTVTCTSLILFFPTWGILACVIGLIVLMVTGYKPIANLVIPAAATLLALMTRGGEAGGVIFVFTLLMLFKNLPGLRRVANGEEIKVLRRKSS